MTDHKAHLTREEFDATTTAFLKLIDDFLVDNIAEGRPFANMRITNIRETMKFLLTCAAEELIAATTQDKEIYGLEIIDLGRDVIDQLRRATQVRFLSFTVLHPEGATDLIQMPRTVALTKERIAACDCATCRARSGRGLKESEAPKETSTEDPTSTEE